MEDFEDGSAAEGEEDVEPQSILNEINQSEDQEFSSRFGYLDLGVSVSKEFNISYFELIKMPAIHVFVLATYLIAKTEKIQREYNKTKQVNA